MKKKSAIIIGIICAGQDSDKEEGLVRKLKELIEKEGWKAVRAGESDFEECFTIIVCAENVACMSLRAISKIIQARENKQQLICMPCGVDEPFASSESRFETILIQFPEPVFMSTQQDMTRDPERAVDNIRSAIKRTYEAYLNI